MILEGCQGKQSSAKLIEIDCPKCGSSVEMMSSDVSAVCEECGNLVINEAFSCVAWCDKAKECVGQEIYDQMMESFANIEETDEDEW